MGAGFLWRMREDWVGDSCRLVGPGLGRGRGAGQTGSGFALSLALFVSSVLGTPRRLLWAGFQGRVR